MAVAAFSQRLPLQTVANALGVMGLITVGFVLFLLTLGLNVLAGRFVRRFRQAY